MSHDEAITPPIPWLPEFLPGSHFTTREIEVTTENIIAFASEYDPQVGHTDPEAAKNTFFQGLASSGWYTAALTAKLVTEEGMPFHGNFVGAGLDIKWPTPTRPGDLLHVELTIVSARVSRSKPDWGIIKCSYDTINQDGEIRQHIRSTSMSVRQYA